jgi:ribosome-associated protein
MPAPIVVDDLVFVPAAAVQVTAVRASGPGGQNVNKVSSKVEVRVDLGAVAGLDAGAAARLAALATPRLDAEGRLLVTSQRTRDQQKNLEDAYEKVRTLLRRALVAPIPRRPTRPSRASVRRRLDEKKKTAARKQQRGPVDEG